MEQSQNPIFGLVASGRLIRTDFVKIDDVHFMINVPDVDTSKHIAVFLTGATPFAEGMGALIYLSWSQNPGQWQLLGSISNSKPSAIFKISCPKSSSANETACSASYNRAVQNEAAIGISVESLQSVEQQVSCSRANSYDNPAVSLDFSKKMLINFYNYVSSFILPAEEIKSQNKTGEFIPAGAAKNWYSNFERKLAINPNFWK